MVSRLIRPKGVETFLEAARLLRGMRRLTFSLIGIHPAANDKLGVSAAALDAAHRNVFVDTKRSDIPAVLGRSTAAVLPTAYGEGVPRFLLEAGAASLPIVTTDTAGCRELLAPGWNGLVIPPNSPRALADAVVHLSDMGDQRRSRMGQRSLEIVRSRFRLDQVVARSLSLYGGYGSAVSSGCVKNNGNGKRDPQVPEVQGLPYDAGYHERHHQSAARTVGGS